MNKQNILSHFILAFDHYQFVTMGFQSNNTKYKISVLNMF